MKEKEYRRLAERVYRGANLYKLLECIRETGGVTEEALVSKFRVSSENIKHKLAISSQWGLLSRQGDIWKLSRTGRNVLISYKSLYE